MHSVHFTLFIAFAFLPAMESSAAKANPPSKKPSAQQLALWVKQLGDERFQERENASKNLWSVGHAAEVVLQEALQSTDLEVVRRAREILDKFKWGIYPDTPPAIVALIRTYQTSEGDARADVIEKLLKKETAGLRALQKITQAETNPQRKKLLRDLVSRNILATFLDTVKGRKYERIERLMEMGHDLRSISHREYVAYWKLRGQLDIPVARFRSLLRQTPEDRFSAETLFYLYRAQGESAKAGEVIRQTKNEVLRENFLLESGDWKALTALADIKSVESPVEKIAFQAAMARLTGDQKKFRRSIEELKKPTESEPEHNSITFFAAKALLLNDKPGDGLQLLTTLPDHRLFLFDFLCTRLEFRQALELARSTEAQEGDSLDDLTLAKARTLSFLGEKDRATRMFKRCFERICKDVDSHFALTLLQEETRAGMTELAFQHCAKFLDLAAKKIEKDPKSLVNEKAYLYSLLPDQAVTAVTCWHLLRQRYKDEPIANVLNRLHKTLRGTANANELKQWIEEIEAQKDPENREEFSRRFSCLAEIALAAGLETQADRLLEKADTSEAFLRRGDLQAAKAQWKNAAHFYLRAWEKGQFLTKNNSPSVFPDPLPLFLAGAGLIEAGKRQDGTLLVEQAHWVPLGDAAARFSFLRSLGERGYKAASGREADILWCISEPNSHFAAAAARLMALDAAQRKQYRRAAQGVEQSMLRCLRQSTQFVANGAYALVPSQVHQLRALSLIEEGKLDACQLEIELSLAAAPGNLDLPIALVPVLETRGQKKEADRLYARCFGVYARLCQQYPRCAWAHNSLAWLAACCRRDLDEALQHARKAIELSPTSAGYHDSLAEVLFQRGEKDQAIRSQRRAIELDPKRAYYRRQLARLQKGDPTTERPLEED